MCEESGADSFTVHFPFKWLHPPGPADTTFEYKDDRPEQFHYVCNDAGEAFIEISRLPNRSYAEQMVYRCWFGLLCYSAMKHRAHEVEAGMAEIDWINDVTRPLFSQIFKEDFTKVDGIVVGRVPYVYREPRNIKRVRWKLTLQTAREVEDSVAEDLVNSCINSRFFELAADRKLLGALEMANLVASEASKLSRFVLLVSALEALMPVAVVSEKVLDRITAWEAEAVAAELDELSDLRVLRYPNIAKRFRAMASDFPPAGAKTRKERRAYLEQVVTAYSCRSDLVHTGTCDEEAMARVYPTVYDLLKRVLADRLRWS